MNRLYRARVSSVDDIYTTVFSTDTSDNGSPSPDSPSQQEPKIKAGDRYRRSTSSCGSYVVDYGPIRVRHRRGISQILATGRRSKDEQLSGEAALKRDLRRAKNRVAARDLKKTRDKIEADLIEKLKELEQERISLQEQHKKLEDRKAQLNRAVYNAKQGPLIPLIADIDIAYLYEVQQRQDLLVDLQPLLKNIDEQFSLSDC